MPRKPGPIKKHPATPWMVDAACIDMDVEQFFEESKKEELKAKEVCQQCPVKEDCLTYAMRLRIPYGIWGGMNTTERDSHRRRLARRRARELTQ